MLRIYKKNLIWLSKATLRIECTCCLKGVVEIKRPSSIVGEKPSYKNYPHLEVTEKSDCRLKENSTYFYQMYSQTAVTESKSCNFFVYTNYGFYVERVTFNQTIWNDTVEKLSWFWQNYVAPNIAKGTFVLGEREEMGKRTHNVTYDVDFSFSFTVNTKPISIKLKHKRLSKEENNIQIKQKKAVMAAYLCGICKTQLESVQKCYDVESIGCDKCPL